MKLSKYTLFIGGGGLLILLIIATAIFNLVKPENNNNHQDDNPLVVETSDPLIIQQLTENDLLPSDLPLITFIDPQRGADNPKVDIVEFSDFACPFCQKLQPTIDRLLKTYPATLRHIWKDAPNRRLHPTAMIAHLAARCAQKQNKFWEYHDELFKLTPPFTAEKLTTIAKNIGLNKKSWQNCFDNGDERAKIERGLVEAEALGVDATPFLFINDRRISGAIDFAQLRQTVNEELSRATTTLF